MYIHNNVDHNLLRIKFSEHLAVSNIIVKIQACLFSNNIGNPKHTSKLIKFDGAIAQVSISDCKFYRNKGSTMITGVLQKMFLTNIYISNTSFLLNNNLTKMVSLSFAKLHLQGPIIFMTVRAKTSLVHTSKFATLVLYNFGWERSTELKFAMSVH